MSVERRQVGALSCPGKGKLNPHLKKIKMEGLGNYRLVSLTCVPGKIMEQNLLEILLRHMKNREVTDDSELVFTEV